MSFSDIDLSMTLLLHHLSMIGIGRVIPHL